MKHPIFQRIASLRGKVRRLLALHGASWVSVGVLIAVGAAGLLDWAIHLNSGVRILNLILVAGAFLTLFIWWVVRPLAVRWTDLALAHRVEARYPGLVDRLTSTLEFLQVGDREDALAGSKALRDATIEQTVREVESIDFRDAIDPQATRRAAGAMLGALACAAAFLLLAPTQSRIAITRLFNPLGRTEWPKETHLVLHKAVDRIARGEPYVLEIGVQPGDRVPSTAVATFTLQDGESVRQTLRPDDNGRFHGRLETVAADFSFQVAAGDDRTASHSVRVVPPPEIESLEIRVTPPAYTGHESALLAPGKTSVDAIVCSKIELTAKASRALGSARLVGADGSPVAEASLSPDGTALSLTLTSEKNASLGLRLVDLEGFKSLEAEETRIDISAIPDEIPRVTIDDPPADRDVTPDAEVPIQVTADDDVGLSSVGLLHTTAAGDGSEPVEPTLVPLWAAPKETRNHKREHVSHVLAMSPFNLAPGSIVTVHAEAADLNDLVGPNRGKSREIRLRIVTKDELARQLDSQRQAIRDEIERTLAMQRQAIAPVQDARRTLEQVPTLPPQIREELQNAESIQRQVAGRVTGQPDSLETRISRFLDDLKNQNLELPEARGQMESLKAGVDRIRQDHLSQAEANLARAVKASPTGEPRPQDSSTPGARANPEENVQGNSTETAKSKSSTPDAGRSSQSNTPSPSSKSSQPQAGEAKARPSKSADASGEAKSGDANPGQSKSGDPKSADSSGEAKTGEAKSGEAKSGEAKSGESKSEGPTKASAQPAQDTPGSRPESSPSPGESQPQSLAQAEANQQAIAQELQGMLDQMREFDTYRGVVQDAKKLLEQHEQAMKSAAEAAKRPDLVAKDQSALSPEQKAELANVAARQSEAAKTLAGLEAKMREMAERTQDQDPLASSALREAAETSQRRGTSARMNETAEQLARNQMNQAQEGQKQSQQDLKRLIDSLQNRRENELARLVRELKDAEKAMQDLRERQARNRLATGAAQRNQNQDERRLALERLSKEQEQIQQELDRQLQRLRKLRAENAAQAGARASRSMARAQQGQQDDDPEEAGQNQEEALEDLNEAQEEIEQARREAEDQLAMEQLAKVSDELKGLHERQKSLVDETAGYEKLRADKGLSLAQRAGVRTLSRTQTTIKDETSDLVERLDAAPSFALALKRAGQNMDSAADRLQKLETGDATQLDQKTAAKRFQQLLEALKPDQGGAGQGGQQGGQQPGGGGGGGGGNSDAISRLAQLKVLKSLQEEVNERTDVLDAQKAKGQPLAPEQSAELERLETDQREIADLTRDIVRPRRDDGEEAQ
jgi:hypothetical protein